MDIVFGFGLLGGGKPSPSWCNQKHRPPANCLAVRHQGAVTTTKLLLRKLKNTIVAALVSIAAVKVEMIIFEQSWHSLGEGHFEMMNAAVLRVEWKWNKTERRKKYKEKQTTSKEDRQSKRTTSHVTITLAKFQ
ncbi:hypothetical protein Dsin_029792 [Dipteronia sinensis]|uniref:Uncharacterized protein n=1 Tax=Dipteronia sinensis TaxID=43782 RepID=A0AAD9ZUK4_9ROSI|nr:hypothetical protein Dsin_029792 [Dipteronia sinensis]